MKAVRAILLGSVLVLGCASLACSQPPEERLQRLALKLMMARDGEEMQSLRDDIRDIARGGHGTEVTLKAWQDILGHDLHHGSREEFKASLAEARGAVDELLVSSSEDELARTFALLVEVRAVECATMEIDREAMETSIGRFEAGEFVQPNIPATVIATHGRIKSGTASSDASAEDLDAFCLQALEDILKLKWSKPAPEAFYATWQFCRQLRGDDSCRDVLAWLDDAMSAAGETSWKREYILLHFENLGSRQSELPPSDFDFESYRDAEMTAMFGDEWKPIIESINMVHSASADSEPGDIDPSAFFDEPAPSKTTEEQAQK